MTLRHAFLLLLPWLDDFDKRSWPIDILKMYPHTKNEILGNGFQWRIQPGAGGHAPRWRPDNNVVFRQYINIITKPTAYDGPREY